MHFCAKFASTGHLFVYSRGAGLFGGRRQNYHRIKPLQRMRRRIQNQFILCMLCNLPVREF